jgi:hypothetical protein
MQAPASVLQELDKLSATAMRQADEAERDALKQYVQTPDLPKWRRDMAQSRFDDLEKRLS